MARPLRQGGRGGGVKAGQLRKGTFFEAQKFNSEKNVATKLEGGGIRP